MKSNFKHINSKHLNVSHFPDDRHTYGTMSPSVGSFLKLLVQAIACTRAACDISRPTILFEGASETHMHKKTGEFQRHEEDVNGDGRTDLVFHFRQNETTLTCNSTQATLHGKTYDGDLIFGTDSIDMKGK